MMVMNQGKRGKKSWEGEGGWDLVACERGDSQKRLDGSNSRYAGQEATVRTRHGTPDWLQIGKGVHQSCILSPCLFNLYAEYIMWNAGLNEAQAGIKMSERGEELKSLLMKVKQESEKAGLKQHSKNKDHDIQSHHFMANRWGNSGNSKKLYFPGLQNHCRWWL